MTHTTTILEQPVPWSQSAVLPAFDPDLGILRQVEITVSGFAYGSFGVENSNASPGFTQLNVSSLVFVTLPNASMPAPNPAFEYQSPSLAAFDGALDFSGASGVSGNFAGETGTGAPSMSVTLFQTPHVAFYVGPSGAPGTFDVGVAPQAGTASGAAPGFQHTHTLAIRVVVRVKYTYDPLPTTFCFSQSWDGCPCGNTGDPGHGCAHSLSAAGGLLGFAGKASLANDTLVLQGSGMTNGVALYFQGSAMQYVGAIYGDGLLCTGGSLVRLGLMSNSGGASSVPGIGAPPLSVHGSVVSPGTRRYYQVQYRNALSFCTSATFNATNAVAIEWAP
ncbi:MAG: choice-of-anchor E domain-containing protein [Planctomycetota bacterium]